MHSSSVPLPLHGWHVLALRPAAECATLRRLASALGARLVCSAAWRIEVDRSQSERLRRALGRTPWVVTSPNAVRAARSMVDLGRLAGPVLAVGPGTARALRRAGAGEVRWPRQGFASEGLLAMPELEQVSAVTLVSGSGGRGLIATKLAERGVAVERLDVYRRVPKVWSPAALTRLDAIERPCALLLSSVESLDSGGAPLAQRLRRFVLIAASERVAEAAAAKGLQAAEVAASAMPADLLQALQRHAKRRPIR